MRSYYRNREECITRGDEDDVVCALAFCLGCILVGGHLGGLCYGTTVCCMSSEVFGLFDCMFCFLNGTVVGEQYVLRWSLTKKQSPDGLFRKQDPYLAGYLTPVRSAFCCSCQRKGGGG